MSKYSEWIYFEKACGFRTCAAVKLVFEPACCSAGSAISTASSPEGAINSSDGQ